MWPNPQFPAGFVIFTEEILNGKLHFLCCETNSRISRDSEIFKRKNFSYFLETCMILCYFCHEVLVCLSKYFTLNMEYIQWWFSSVTLFVFRYPLESLFSSRVRSMWLGKGDTKLLDSCLNLVISQAILKCLSE